MALLDLFRPKWRHSDVEIRLKAVSKIENHVLLARIATEDKNVSVCKAAVWRVNDQTLLTKIALEAKAECVRATAAQRVSDQVLLAKIAIESDWISRNVHRAAAERVTDDALL